MMKTSRFRSLFLLLSIFSAIFACGLAPVADAAEPEIRGLWIEAWKNDLKTRAGIDRIISDAKAGNFNTLIAQVRRRGDTLYFSDIEPRIEDSALASNFDALAYLLERAHAQNPPIEVHAWVVAYPIWRTENKPPKSPDHIFNKHPDWLSVSDTGGLFEGGYQHDPGHPGVQQHLFDVSMELVEKYDIDGLHFDYIRLTGNNWGYNPVSLERFRKLYNRTGKPDRRDPEWLQFRRDQITQTLRKIYVSAVAIRPEVKVSAATITWAPGPRNVNEYHTRTSAYLSVLQDWRAWMEEGILDINFPMAYFREHTHPTDWTNWINFTKDHQYDRHAAIGPGVYLNYLPNVIKQMRDTRAPSPAGNRARGVAAYSYQQTDIEFLPFSTFARALTQESIYDPVTPPLFEEPAAIPEMPWKTNPVTGHLKGFVRNAYTNQPADGAIVGITGEVNRTIQADATGFYAFVDLPPGDYVVSATWMDADEAAPATMLSVSAGEVGHQDLSFFVPGDIEGEEVEIIVDNEDPAVTYLGDWQISTNPNGYGPTYHFAETVSGAATASAIYAPVLPGAGRYRIDTWHFESWNRAPNAPFTVSDGETELLVLVDQQNVGRRWMPLVEEIELDPAKNPFVRIDNNATNNVVLADAVRWTWLDAPAGEPEVKFAVSAEIVGKGRLEGLPEDGKALHGTELNLLAVGEEGHRFSHWGGNAWGEENPLSLHVGADLALKAFFVSLYEEWMAETFSAEEMEDESFVAPEADPLGHGIPNLLKYAFGLDFRSPDSGRLPRVESNGTDLLVVFERRREDSALAFDLLFSTDLKSWEMDEERMELVSVVPVDEKVEEVTFRIDRKGSDRLFVRLQVGRR